MKTMTTLFDFWLASGAWISKATSKQAAYLFILVLMILGMNSTIATAAVSGYPAPTLTATQGTVAGTVAFTWSVAPAPMEYISIFMDGVAASAVFMNPANQSATLPLPSVGHHTFTAQWSSGNNGYYDEPKSTAIAGWAGDAAAAPASVGATQGTEPGNINITWAAVSGATSYQVYLITGAGSLRYTGPALNFRVYVGGTAAYPFAVRALVGSSYTFLSAAVTGYAGTPLAAPTGVTATQGTALNSVNLAWAAVATATNYEILRDNVSIATVTARSFSDTVTTTASHSYKIRGKKGDSEGPLSTAVTGYAAIAPAAPTGVTATQGTLLGKARLTWSAAPTATSYKVYRDATLIYTGAALTFDDSRSTSATYSYTITATNSSGTGSASTAVSGYAAITPVAPTSVTATQGTVSGAVNLGWTAVTNATSYRVYRDAAIVSTGAALTISDPVPSSSTYSYTVEALSGTFAGPLSAVVSGYASITLTAPSSITASQGIHSGYVAINWSASQELTGMGHYAIYADGSASACGVTATASPPALTGNCTTADVLPHNYTVKAYDSVSSTYSVDSAIATGFSYAPPASAPTNLSASQGTFKGGIQLTWDVATDTDLLEGYSLFRDGSNSQDIGIRTSFTDPIGDTDSHSYLIRGRYANRQGADSMPAAGFSGGGPAITKNTYRVRIY